MVGLAVGLAVVGLRVGLAVGLGVGLAVGLTAGAPVGPAVSPDAHGAHKWIQIPFHIPAVTGVMPRSYDRGITPVKAGM